MSQPLPELFIEKIKALLGTEYLNFINSYEQPASKGLRLNTLKLDHKSFLALSPFALTPVPWAKDGYYYSSDARPGKHPYHAAGLYYIQEPSAMSVVEVLDPQPGETILDVAAAPGGKATQIAVKMNNTGLVIANEVHPARAKILSENVERLGITNTIVTNEEVHRLAERWPNYFDRILLDAPCSGEGMFRKDEDARSEWNPNSVHVCATRQQDLLDHAASMVKPGGRLVYSTCTFSPEENEQVIDEFLKRHPDWQLKPIPHEHGICPGRPEWTSSHNEELSKTARLWPHLVQGEGHYIALLEKGGESTPTTAYSNKNEKSKKNSPLLVEAIKHCKSFMKDALQIDWKLDPERLILFGSQLYLLPVGAPSIEQLKVVRAGLHLGELKKNRFEPSHALALALSERDIHQSVSLRSDRPEITAYLSGHSITIDPMLSGWTGVLVDGFPIGWGKASQGMLKNHYPKGLRQLGI